MGKRAATRPRAKGAPRRYRSPNGVRAAPHAGHFDAGLWELAQRTAASSAELIQLEGPFVAECWLSDLASIWENVELIDDDAEKVIGLSVVDERLRRRARALSPCSRGWRQSVARM